MSTNFPTDELDELSQKPRRAYGEGMPVLTLLEEVREGVGPGVDHSCDDQVPPPGRNGGRNVGSKVGVREDIGGTDRKRRHSLGYMTGIQLDALERGSIGTADARPENYRLNEATGMIERTVRRSAPGAPAVTTVVGPSGSDLDRCRLDTAADSVFLHSQEWPASADGTAIRVADLFSGCGAMSIGVREACRALGLRFEAAGAFDIDSLALGVYAKNFGLRPALARPCDVGAVLAKYPLRSKRTRAERRLRRRVGRVDLVVAGPPCQGHSDLNNSSRRKDPRNELYLCVARFAKVFTPRWIIVENVTAVQHDRGEVVRRTKEALKLLGYEVVEGVVHLRKLGVPQTRRRHLLVAVRRKGHGRVEKTLEPIDKMVARYVTNERTVRWAIGDLDGLMGPAVSFDSPSRATKRTRQRIDWLFDHQAHDLPDERRPDCHRKKAHSYKSVYGRMWWDRPAPTITGGFETMGRGRFVHPEQRRTITPHEAARLQLIPDFFDFSPVWRVHSRLAEIIGNAVPPKLSYVIALELMR